jgi:hypothetical protein
MSAYEIISIIGIAAVLGAFLYIGRKLQVLDDLEKTTSKIKVNVKVISDYLTTSNVDFNHSELQAYSPLKLTKKGEE